MRISLYFVNNMGTNVFLYRMVIYIIYYDDINKNFLGSLIFEGSNGTQLYARFQS